MIAQIVATIGAITIPKKNASVLSVNLFISLQYKGCRVFLQAENVGF